MHIITGGEYNGVDYSCMFHENDKYDDISPNGKYYYQFGLVKATDKSAILVFDVETDKLKYAEEVDFTYTTEEAAIDFMASTYARLEAEHPWLTDTDAASEKKEK